MSCIPALPGTKPSTPSCGRATRCSISATDRPMASSTPYRMLKTSTPATTLIAHARDCDCARDCDRGEWAFRGGAPVPLGREPELVHYEALRERPEPHYP